MRLLRTLWYWSVNIGKLGSAHAFKSELYNAESFKSLLHKSKSMLYNWTFHVYQLLIKMECPLFSQPPLFILLCHHWIWTLISTSPVHCSANWIIRPTGSWHGLMISPKMMDIDPHEIQILTSSYLFTAHQWLSWLSIELSRGRLWVRIQPDQHSGS